MTNYLQTDVLRRAEALGLKARTIVEGLRVGDHKSPYRGFSVEFVQHREYVPGDDVRHIDWKSYGRSERYTIKQYEQETNFTGHLVVDASRSMLYGEGETNKLEYAKLVAATLAYLILHQRDSVSLRIFDANWRTELPPSSQLGHLQTILETLQRVKPEEKTRIGPLLDHLADTVRRRALVFLISDCFDEPASLLKGIQHLRFQEHEVVVFHLLHPDELNFAFEGMIRFDGLEIPDRLLARPQVIRRAYLRAMEEFRTQLQQGCTARRCDYILLDTSRPLGPVLADYLAARLRTRRV
jgi:uncharacterized protein (DUF58 family)